MRLITQAPGVLRDAQDVPIASAEVVVIANVPKRATGTDANVEVRGVGPGVWALRPELRIVEGRPFTPGLRELVVGIGARRQFSGLEPGNTLQLNNQTWTVVGVFASGDAHESEIWGDAESVASAYRRNAFQSVTLRLTGPEALDNLKAALTGDPRLRVDAETTRSYYSKQSEQLTEDHPHPRHRDRGDHGLRRRLRGAQHHVCRRRSPRPRDRDAARAGLRRPPRRGGGDARDDAACPGRRR